MLRLLAVALLAAPAVAADAVVPFNGKDLTGWKLRNNANPNCWSVADGSMTNKMPCADIISDTPSPKATSEAEFRLGIGSARMVILLERCGIGLAKGR